MKLNPYVCVGAGFAAGALTGVLATRRYFSKQVDVTLANIEKLLMDEDVLAEEEVKKGDAIVKVGPTAAGVESNNVRMMNMDYSKLAKQAAPEAEPEESIDEEEIEPVEELYPVDEEGIYEISESDFHEEYNDYEKVTFSLYDEDDTLCDENECPIDDISGYVGDVLGHFQDSHDTLYVRNHDLRIDIEILYREGAYGDGRF